MPGAPVLSGTAGSLISILDACLVTGFGSAGITSLTVASGVATANFAAAHPYEVASVALIAGAVVTGASPAALNGEKRILSTTATSVTFNATGVTDQTATGSATARVAGAGWTKPFTGTNKAVYRNNSVTGTGMYLRMDDSEATVGRLRGYEVMTDVDTGVNLFPTLVQHSGPGLWWSKSNGANSTSKQWTIFADSRGVYWMMQGDPTWQYRVNFFGDINSVKANDPYACVIRADIGDRSNNPVVGEDLMFSQRIPGVGNFVAREANTISKSTAVGHCLSCASQAGDWYPGSSGYVFPSAVDNGLVLAPYACIGSNAIRGYFPGLMASPQLCGPSFSHGDTVLGSGPLTGKRYSAVKTGSVGSSVNGVLFFDTLADWRA